METNPKEHVTTGKWMGLLLLNLIPILGQLILLVLYLVWAFGHTPQRSLKTFARASLIMLFVYAIVILILVGVFSVLFADTISALMGALQALGSLT